VEVEHVSGRGGGATSGLVGAPSTSISPATDRGPKRGTRHTQPRAHGDRELNGPRAGPWGSRASRDSRGWWAALPPQSTLQLTSSPILTGHPASLKLKRDLVVLRSWIIPAAARHDAHADHRVRRVPRPVAADHPCPHVMYTSN